MNKYYKILGVRVGATELEIKRAYRKLAMKFHPDTSKEANSAEKFIEINTAYEYLINPDLRNRKQVFRSKKKRTQAKTRAQRDWDARRKAAAEKEARRNAYMNTAAFKKRQAEKDWSRDVKNMINLGIMWVIFVGIPSCFFLSISDGAWLGLFLWTLPMSIATFWVVRSVYKFHNRL